MRNGFSAVVLMAQICALQIARSLPYSKEGTTVPFRKFLAFFLRRLGLQLQSPHNELSVTPVKTLNFFNTFSGHNGGILCRLVWCPAPFADSLDSAEPEQSQIDKRLQH